MRTSSLFITISDKGKDRKMARREQENKVLFGFSDLYIGTYSVNDETGQVTLGTPYKQTGAVGWSPEGQGENYTFWADNMAYYSSYTTGSYEGDLVVARFDDEFRKQFMGEVELEDGGIAEVKNPVKPSIYMMYEFQGDKGPERVIWYNGSLGVINREAATIEDSVEVQTETISLTFTGDNETGITKVTYGQDKAGFATLFDNPPVPKLPEQASE